MEQNLSSCRMYERRYPEVDRLVMGKVKSILNNEAVVSLLEFAEIEAKVYNSGERDLLVGRAMPFRVLDGNENAIVLSPSPLSLEEKWHCEREYVKARHVHRVLFSVAEDMEMNLETLYEVAGWPTYEQLLVLHEDQTFLDSNPDLREFILERVKLMVYVSWRIEDPRVLQFCTHVQMFNTSYATALVRQTEAYLKLRERLPYDTYLSTQDLVNKVARAGLLDTQDGSVAELAPIARIIVDQGLVLDSVCPVQNNYNGAYSIDNARPVGRIGHARVYIVDGNVPTEVVATHIIHRVFKTGPITCSLLLYPSYQNNLQQDIIYEPTPEEALAYGVADLDAHSMICTGHGVDRWGKAFLEFQGSRGNINSVGVDHGFVRFAHKDTVADYVFFMENGYDSD